MSVEPGFTKI